MEIYKLKVAFEAVKGQLEKQKKKYEDKISTIETRYKKRLAKYTGKKLSGGAQQAAGNKRKKDDEDEYDNDGAKKKRSREI